MDNKSEMVKKYDQLYEREATAVYEVTPISLNGWPVDRKQAMVKMARRGGRLLEIGCGRGQVLATLAPHFDDVVGIELSSIRADRAREALAPYENITIMNEPLELLPDIIDEPFDCIIWADVIEHIVDVIDAMRQIGKLSKKGTQLVTITPNVGFLPQRLNILRGKAPNTAIPWFPNEGFSVNPKDTAVLDAGHLHYFTFRQLEILYEITGFKPTERLGVGNRIPVLHNWWPTLLSGLVCVAGEYVGD